MEYTAEEIATWKEVYSKVVEIYPGKACSIQIQRLDIMMKACGFAVDNIPQMEDVSNYLKSNVLLTLLGLGSIKINDVSANFNDHRPSLILNN